MSLSNTSDAETSFADFGLPQKLLASLQSIGFNNPTEIQKKVIPEALSKHDILASSQTGTGKTGAFCIPMIAMLHDNTKYNALIIAPTRELATQIMKSCSSIANQKIALLIGGDDFHKQIQQLKRKPSIIIGTPGRINDHINRGNFKLDYVKFVVLDEVDRMLDMGFAVQIREIFKYISSERQTMMFSATLPKNIINLSEKYMQEPIRISVGSTSRPVEGVTQDIININDDDKYQELINQLDKRDGSVIVFLKTKYGTERMVKRLKADNYTASAMHGDLRHNKREKAIKDFRNNKCRILIATDLAARGLDIPHIKHVINYDLPQCPEDYIHRIGRTARAGMQGDSISFVSPKDKKKWQAIHILMNPEDAKKTHANHQESNDKAQSSSKRRYKAQSGTRSSKTAYSTSRRGTNKPRGHAMLKNKNNQKSNSRNSYDDFIEANKPHQGQSSNFHISKNNNKFNNEKSDRSEKSDKHSSKRTMSSNRAQKRPSIKKRGKNYSTSRHSSNALQNSSKASYAKKQKR